jgi:hypothetical protein
VRLGGEMGLERMSLECGKEVRFGHSRSVLTLFEEILHFEKGYD